MISEEYFTYAYFMEHDHDSVSPWPNSEMFYWVEEELNVNTGSVLALGDLVFTKSCEMPTVPELQAHLQTQAGPGGVYVNAISGEGTQACYAIGDGSSAMPSDKYFLMRCDDGSPGTLYPIDGIYSNITKDAVLAHSYQADNSSFGHRYRKRFYVSSYNPNGEE